MVKPTQEPLTVGNRISAVTGHHCQHFVGRQSDVEIPVALSVDQSAEEVFKKFNLIIRVHTGRASRQGRAGQLAI